MFPPQRIMVPSDLTEHSDLALGRAILIAKAFGAKIYLFHVVDEVVQQCSIDYCIDTNLIDGIIKGSVKTSHVLLKKQIERAIGSNGIDIQLTVKLGDPYEEILKFQKSKEIDLIVMTPHGKKGGLKNLIGGVADKIVRSVDCPILLIKE